jgi:hypothetical protein
MERTLRNASPHTDGLEVTPQVRPLHSATHRRALTIDEHVLLSVRSRKLNLGKYAGGLIQ